MPSVTLIILLAFIRLVANYTFNAQHVMDNLTRRSVDQVQDVTERLGDKLIGDFFDRTLKVSPLNYVGLDETALQKSGRLAISPWTKYRSLVPLYAYPQSTRSDSASPLASYRPQSAKAKQLLQFTEPETDVTVKLVGVMHFNPSSKQLVSDTIEELAEDGKLGSIIIETCDIRRNVTKQLPPMLQSILRSEMGTACDLARLYNRPVVSGDQRINVTGLRIKAAFQETLNDLSLPLQGWQRIIRNITATLKGGFPSGDDTYLSALDFLDDGMLLGVPEALSKYFLSYLVKVPVQTLLALAVVILATDYNLNLPDDQVTYAGTALVTLIFGSLEYGFFARIILKTLLQERNEFLAESILRQCRLYQKRTGLSSSLRKSRSMASISVSNTSDADRMGGDKTIVAVLGMAHCNGVMKLLKRRQVGATLGTKYS